MLCLVLKKWKFKDMHMQIQAKSKIYELEMKQQFKKMIYLLFWKVINCICHLFQLTILNIFWFCCNLLLTFWYNYVSNFWSDKTNVDELSIIKIGWLIGHENNHWLPCYSLIFDFFPSSLCHFWCYISQQYNSFLGRKRRRGRRGRKTK